MYAKCKLNKKLGHAFQSGNVISRDAKMAKRISAIIQLQSTLKSASFVIQDVSLNVYGQKTGGPNGYGSSPKNTF